MSQSIRRAVLAPVLVSSLALGSVAFLQNVAGAAVPAASCSVTQSANGTSFDVKGQGFKPGESLTLSSKSGSASTVVGAEGTFTALASSNIGPITAKQEGESAVTCGTVKEAEQKDAQDQYRKGFRQGLADTKEDCKKEPPKPGVAPLDPEYERGYNAGATAALASQLCKSGT